MEIPGPATPLGPRRVIYRVSALETAIAAGATFPVVTVAPVFFRFDRSGEVRRLALHVRSGLAADFAALEVSIYRSREGADPYDLIVDLTAAAFAPAMASRPRRDGRWIPLAERVDAGEVWALRARNTKAAGTLVPIVLFDFEVR